MFAGNKGHNYIELGSKIDELDGLGQSKIEEKPDFKDYSGVISELEMINKSLMLFDN